MTDGKQQTFDVPDVGDVCAGDGCDAQPPGANLLCADCLGSLRHRDSAADYDDYNEYLRRVNDE